MLCLGRPAAGEREVFRRKDSYCRTKGRSCTGTWMRTSDSLLWTPFAGDARSA